MQPDPSEISTQFSEPSNHYQPVSTSQHGIQSLATQPRSCSYEQLVYLTESSSSTANARNNVLGSGKHTLLGRMNEFENHSSHPEATVQQISEHEKASAQTALTNQTDGSGFKVVKIDCNPLSGPQLENFPNEVLTHVLSHLPASSLSAVSLVSRRFYNLVTTQHAWRLAFSRFFPGQDAIISGAKPRVDKREAGHQTRENIRAEQRLFTRLTPLASWRSEYILRTRLLRSIIRGKPSRLVPGHSSSSRPNNVANNANAIVTYNSQLFASINHIHAVFNDGKKSPRFIHGTNETGSACTSDPTICKVDNWGFSDPQSLPQFVDIFPGDQPYGLGEGLLVGAPNVMDVSQPYGIVYGEGFPGGQTYFRGTDELRGRFLTNSTTPSESGLEIPKIPAMTEAICAVWIAKSHFVPSMTEGLLGILTGSSCGIVTAYSLGADNLRGSRLRRGEITAKWILSPGVPIIALRVDDCYSVQRKSAGRILAAALNALGEVYYLKDPLERSPMDKGAKSDEAGLVARAWATGRDSHWELMDLTRRVARDDPYKEAKSDGSYSPRSSSRNMNLSKDQMIAEVQEIERFLTLRPIDFRKACEGWDMRRLLEVDFAGDDGNGAGEIIVVIGCGFGSGIDAQIKRYTRLKSIQASLDGYPVPKTPPDALASPPMASLFGGSESSTSSRHNFIKASPSRSASPASRPPRLRLPVKEWRGSLLSLEGHQSINVTASAIDKSKFALLTVSEDPLLSAEVTAASSSFSASAEQFLPSVSGVPGHRARFVAIGTNTGTIMLWNMRGPQSSNAAVYNDLQPLRIIYTDSPKISCIALSASYLVHGGNDGLVQAWDPLASTLQPVRTLNSRFSSRARRRLVQAEASIHGVGSNLFAAGAIIVDPDPTVLRGMVSLGTHLRYWSYSSSVGDHHSSRKRRLRRSAERGSNAGPDRFTSTGRGALTDYIAAEHEELKKEKQRRAREESRLRGRFGVGLGGLTDEEALRYAEMISQETFERDRERRGCDFGYSPGGGESPSASSQAAWSSETVTPEGSVAEQLSSPRYTAEDEFDNDLEEAIRLSLLDGVDDGGRSPRASGSGGYDTPITFKQKKSRRSASSSTSSSQASKSRSRPTAMSRGEVPVDDLNFALRLSLSEQQSLEEASPSLEQFPALDDITGAGGKGKGKERVG